MIHVKNRKNFVAILTAIFSASATLGIVDEEDPSRIPSRMADGPKRASFKMESQRVRVNNNTSPVIWTVKFSSLYSNYVSNRH